MCPTDVPPVLRDLIPNLVPPSQLLRRGALAEKVNYTTTLNAAFATCMSHTADAKATVTSVQELHAKVKASLA